MSEELNRCKLCEMPIPRNRKVPDRVVHTRCEEELAKIFLDAGLGAGSDMMARLSGLFELHKDELENTEPVKSYRAREAAAIARAEAKFPGWKRMREEAKAKEEQQEQQPEPKTEGG
jgi:hypothetical protein